MTVKVHPHFFGGGIFAMAILHGLVGITLQGVEQFHMNGDGGGPGHASPGHRMLCEGQG